jgi:RNA polymerase sigma factor (sigma-70 family)
VKPPFQRLIDDHSPAVKRFLTASVGPSEAEDCFQETFIAALRAYPGLKRTDNLRGWLLTIARNKAIDHFRANKRVSVGSVPELPHHDPEAIDPALIEAVASLPEKQRSAVALRYVTDLPFKDVADIMGCSPEAARRSVHEGIKKLREVWEP